MAVRLDDNETKKLEANESLIVKCETASTSYLHPIDEFDNLAMYNYKV